jgi:hypothetical protein
VFPKHGPCTFMQLRVPVFWDVMRCLLVIDFSGQPVGPVFRGRAVRLETSVTNYQPKLLNIVQERTPEFSPVPLRQISLE